MGLHTPTIHLLSASVLVGFSGAFRILIAFLLLGAEPDFLDSIACGLVVYTVYTLDRTLECREDSVNRYELTDSRKDIGLLVSISIFIIGTYFLIIDGLYIIPFLPFLVGFLYNKCIKIGKYNLKLKGGLGVKNFVVGLTWGAFIAGITGKSVDSKIPLLVIFSFFSGKVFINSVIYDIKDMKGDSLVGIRTLPVHLGEKKTVSILSIMHLFLHLGMFTATIMNFIEFEPVILLYSFVAGIICIIYYSASIENESRTRKIIREFLVDAESIIAFSLRAIINSL